MGARVEELEQRRRKLLGVVSNTGDMRRGSINEVYRRCGKANCVCKGPGHPGHGPYYAFTRKRAGKTETVQLRAGADLDKLIDEVQTYHEFRATIEELIEINEEICKLRPVPAVGKKGREPHSLKKKLPRSSRRRLPPRSKA